MGSAVGALVVGAAVGVGDVGAAVEGDAVGAAEGVVVGCRVGFAVGSPDGRNVGFCVAVASIEPIKSKDRIIMLRKRGKAELENVFIRLYSIKRICNFSDFRPSAVS